MIDLIKRYGTTDEYEIYEANEYPEDGWLCNYSDYKALLDQIDLKNKTIDIQSIQLSDMAGALSGSTCIMCNYLERADCYDQKTNLQLALKNAKEKNGA